MSSYRELSQQRPDFRIRYRWYAEQDPHQQIRCDFAYADDDIAATGIYMIWPEFEIRDGVPYEKSDRIPRIGKASMWIVSDTMREEVHAHRIEAGVLGHFVIGSTKIGDIEVTQALRVSEYKVRC